MSAELNRRGFIGVGAGATLVAAAAVGTIWSSPAIAAPSNADLAGGLGDVLDFVELGNATSEQTHSLVATSSRVVAGALEQPARVFEALNPAQWWGGSFTAVFKVDPEKTNYVTAKFWGDDHAVDLEHAWRMQYFIDGKVLGYFDQSFIDNADTMEKDPRSPGRFFMHTLPLPEQMTAGKTTVEIQLRSMGRIYPYGNSSNYFQDLTGDSRGVYRVYTHSAPYFEPAADDPVGEAPSLQLRAANDVEAVEAIRLRALMDQTNMLAGFGHDVRDGFSIECLALGYNWSESPAFHNDATISQMCSIIDAYYRDWKASDSVLTNQWQGFGRIARSLTLLWESPSLQRELDATVSQGRTTLTNPGFEAGGATPSGWQRFSWAGQGTISRDTTVSHSGQSSLRVDSVASNSVIGPQGRTLCGEGPFTASVWVKSDGGPTTIELNVLFWNAAGALVGGDHKVAADRTSLSWQKVQQTIQVPAGASQFEVWFIAGGVGRVWFDDVDVQAPALPASNLPTRRAGYTDMLVASRDYWSANARPYTNQALIVNTGIYQANRALKALSPESAWPEAEAMAWVREAIGLDPWLGSRRPDGTRDMSFGTQYHTVSRAGITRELGYVGSYGEVANWLVALLDSVQEGYAPEPSQEVLDHIVNMVKARAHFRYYDIDKDGKKVSRMESVIGWRIEKYPAEIAYVQRTVVESNPLQAASTLGDAEIEGWARRMIDEGQLAPQIGELATNRATPATLNALRFASHDYPEFITKTTSSRPLPCEWDQPDFLLADEDNGAIALKSAKEMLFVSTYWRARQGVNGYARIHLVRPTGERSATIRERVGGIPEGTDTFTVPNWTTWDWALGDPAHAPIPPGGFPAPVSDTLDQAFQGTTFPVMPLPADIPDPTFGGGFFGQERILVGRAPYYSFEFGGYSVGQNTSDDQTFELTNPFDASVFVYSNDSSNGSFLSPGQVLPVKPKTTLVLKRLSGTVRCLTVTKAKVVGKFVKLDVTVTNTSSVMASVTATSNYGTKQFLDLPPNHRASHSFTTRATSIDAGAIATVTTGTVDGLAVSVQDQSAYGSYPA